ncbi:hypothetical protein Tco_0108958 [Tanacetum coccineum]
MLLNLDQQEKQLDKEEFLEIGSMDAFRYFLAYTRIEVQQFRDTLTQHMESIKKSIDERALHKREYGRSGNDVDTEDADIKLVNDQEPLAEVPLTAQHNVLAIEQ